MGFYGMFNGTPMIRIKQSPYTWNIQVLLFQIEDLWVVSGHTKPV